jgi:hypothetical protein
MVDCNQIFFCFFRPHKKRSDGAKKERKKYRHPPDGINISKSFNLSAKGGFIFIVPS